MDWVLIITILLDKGTESWKTMIGCLCNVRKLSSILISKKNWFLRILANSFALQVCIVLIFSYCISADNKTIKEECLLYYVYGWRYIANFVVWRSANGQHGVYWFVEDSCGEKFTLYWHAESGQNTQIFGTSSLHFCKVRIELLISV